MPNALNEIIESSTKGGFVLVLGNVVSNLILALGLIIVPRLLGPDQYGIYSLAFVFPYLLILFADFGVNLGLTRFSASLRAEGKNRKAAEFLKQGLLFKAIIALIFFAVSIIFADYFAAYLLNRPNEGIYIRIASLALPTQVIFDAASAGLVGLERMTTVSIISCLLAVVKVTVSVGLVLLGFGIMGAVTGQVIGFAVAVAVGSLVIFLKYYPKLRVSNTTEERTTFPSAIKTLMAYGFPLYLSAVLAGFIPQFQNVILAQFVTNADIGNLRAAVNLLTLLSMITIPVTTTLFPAFSKLDPLGEDIQKFFYLSVKYTTLLVVPATFMVLLFSENIVYIAYGSSYTSAPLFLLFYCAIYLLVGLGSLVLSVFFNGTGKTWTTFKMSLLGLSITLLLTIPLTALQGVVGLIMAQVIATFFVALYGLKMARHRFKVSIDVKNLTKIYALSIIAALPVLILIKTSNSWWVWDVLLGTTVYLSIWITLAPLMGILQKSELKNIAMATEKVPIIGKILKPIISYETKLIVKKNRYPSNKI